MRPAITRAAAASCSSADWRIDSPPHRSAFWIDGGTSPSSNDLGERTSSSTRARVAVTRIVAPSHTFVTSALTRLRRTGCGGRRVRFVSLRRSVGNVRVLNEPRRALRNAPSVGRHASCAPWSVVAAVHSISDSASCSSPSNGSCQPTTGIGARSPSRYTSSVRCVPKRSVGSVDAQPRQRQIVPGAATPTSTCRITNRDPEPAPSMPRTVAIRSDAAVRPSNSSPIPPTRSARATTKHGRELREVVACATIWS